METAIRTYGELCQQEPGIYRKVVDGTDNSSIYVITTDPDHRPTTITEYVDWYDVDGDDQYMATMADEKAAPHVSYEKIDEYANVTAYLTKEQAEKALACRRNVIPYNPGKKKYLSYDIELLEAYLNK